MNEFAQPAERITTGGPDGDELVAAYLNRVRAAAAGLDPGRREELIEDLREHIATARAELSPETEAGVRTLLERLGDPAAIAAEASAGEPSVPPPTAGPPGAAPPGAAPPGAAPPGAAPPGVTPPSPPSPPRSNRVVVTVLVTVVALVLLAPIAACVLGLGLFSAYRVETDQPPEPVTSFAPAPSLSPGAS
jgi:hypothetical protein